MAQKNDQANSVPFLAPRSGHSQTSNAVIFDNGLSNNIQSSITPGSKIDNPTIVVVTHTGELLEDNKEGSNSFLTLETKREIIEALQRSGLEDSEITTVVVEDPILDNFAATHIESLKSNEAEKTIVSSHYSAEMSVDTPLYAGSIQPLLVQNVSLVNTLSLFFC